MNINAIDSTNFQARLDISKVKTNKSRWKNISKIFKEITAENPNGGIKVVEEKHDTSIICLKDKEINDSATIDALIFNPNISCLLKKYNDDEVAKKLVRLYEIGDVASLRKIQAYETYQRKVDNYNWMQKEDFIQQYEQKELEIENAVIKKIEKDSFLKNFKVMV